MSQELIDSFWEGRPVWAGGSFHVPFGVEYSQHGAIRGKPLHVTVDAEELAVAMWWHIGTATALHTAGHIAGGSAMRPGQFVNIMGGESLGLYRPGQVTHVGRHTMIKGSALSLTEAAWLHRWRLLRFAGSAARILNPIATAVWLGYELYHAPAVTKTNVQQAHFDKYQTVRDREIARGHGNY